MKYGWGGDDIGKILMVKKINQGVIERIYGKDEEEFRDLKL